MAPSHILQIFLRVTVQNQIGIAQRIVVDEVVQFRPLRHGHVQFILDPSAVNGDHSPIPEQQLHAAGVHVEFAGSFIVLHVCVPSALRHLYSCDFCYTVLLIRFRTHSGREGTGIIISEENKKSEPFSYRERFGFSLFGATGRIRTSGLPGRRTTTSPYRPTLKREFCWFCTVASKARKRLLVVVTTGFSVFYGASAQ